MDIYNVGYTFFCILAILTFVRILVIISLDMVRELILSYRAFRDSLRK